MKKIIVALFLFAIIQLKPSDMYKEQREILLKEIVRFKRESELCRLMGLPDLVTQGAVSSYKSKTEKAIKRLREIPR